MAKYIDFICEEEGICARAELLEDQAPNTCKLVWDILPVETYFHHAYYSGPELAMILPEIYEIEPEKPTSVILPWEICFTTLKAKDYIDVERDFSEFCFFYDRNTGPRMLDGLCKVTIFARFVDSHEKLKELGYRMRKEGQKLFRVRRVEEDL